MPNYKQFNSPNRGSKFSSPPRFIVLHFTAGSSLASSTSWLCNKLSKASAHLVVGKDGTVNQLVPFDTIAWHAGESSWKGVDGLNKYSIGIELDNQGALLLKEGVYRGAATGKVVAPDNVFHGKQAGSSYEHWDKYTEPQLASLSLVIADLKKKIPTLQEIVGHSDIAPTRKIDPGPACPASAFLL